MKRREMLIAIALGAVLAAGADAASRGVAKGWPLGTGQRTRSPFVNTSAPTLLAEDGTPLASETGRNALTTENTQ